MARSATGVVRVAAIPLLIWLFRDRLNHPRRGLRPWLPLLIPGGEPLCRVSRQKLVRMPKITLPENFNSFA